MTTVPNPDAIQLAFAEAIREFKSKLRNDQLYTEILKTNSIDEVYNTTDAIQADQAQHGRLRHLSKLKPFLEGLRGYAETIDTFVQVKPDVLALIWGPIKLLIQWTASLSQSMDALVNTAAQIGELIPEFKAEATIFGNDEQVKRYLVLFFQDILDFYAVTLKFFGLPHWRIMFEALWPSQKEKIKIVIDSIERHTISMRNKVRLEHLREEYEHRQRALDHFEATQKSNMRQEYNTIKTDISPRSYDSELYLIQGKVCTGTGDWLEQASDFKKWLKGDDDSTRILWLCGIPGAGKTHLAAMAIDFVKSTRTIFAFLSHANSSSTTALSVVHSLIFQLTYEDEGLQAVLCGLSRRNFKNSLDVAVGFLQMLLNSTGRVSIIIDGVDEIDVSEREKLLKKLCEISAGCKKTLLLISSRAEHDISTIVGRISSTIRVDTHNAASIQVFVDDWAERWFSAHAFTPEVETQIKKVLAPLSLKAKGMFLYAKIMLHSIEEFDTLKQIRDHLKVLPEDLDEVYQILFEKINRKPELVKKKCRLILGWISCSPTPLTLLELEQALVVTIDGTSQVLSPLNFVSLCGPIVEVVGNNIQFVHFTVKEYIHSRHKKENYIDLTNATLSLAICCLQYLCQDHHSPDISEEDLEVGIKMGDYRLHYYATDAWLNLVNKYLHLNHPKALSRKLIRALETFYKERRKQDSSDRRELDEQRYPPELQQFESRSPNVFCFLRSIAQFQQKCSTSLAHPEQENHWVDLNPVTTSTISKILYTKFDQLECQMQQHTGQCLCSTLKRHYGQRLYKCGFFSCSFYRHGFSTRDLRDLHRKNHNLSWKCDIPSCHYSEVGFVSKAMRDNHLDLHRSEAQDESLNHGALLLDPDSDDFVPLLFDLVGIDDVGSVETLPPIFNTLEYYDKAELLKFVARSGSAAMMKLICEKLIRQVAYFSHWHDVVLAGVDGQNIETLTVLLGNDLKVADELQRYYDQNYCHELLRSSIATGSMEVIQAIGTHLSTAYASDKEGLLKALLDRSVIGATAGYPDREEYLVNAWSTHGVANLKSAQLFRALCFIAQTTHSIRLARALLQYGVNILQQPHHGTLAPLHIAARHDSAEAAEFMKFLLYQGASPDIQGIRDEKCVKNISNWLGLSWDELIQKVNEDREGGFSGHDI